MRWFVASFALLSCSVSAQPSWTRVSDAGGLQALRVLDDGVLLAGTSTDGLRSVDGGASFDTLAFLNERDGIQRIAVLPATPDRGLRVFAAGRTGGYYSDDRGLTWQSGPPRIHNPGCVPVTRYSSVATSEPGTVVFAGNRHDPSSCNTMDHSFISRDGGESWSDDIGPFGYYLVNGFLVEDDIAIVDGHLISVRDGFLYRLNLATGVGEKGPEADPARNAIASMTTGAAGQIYVGFRVRHPDRQASTGIWRSDDAGRNWVRANHGLPSLDITALHVLADGRVVAGARGVGVFGSDDHGRTWTSMSQGLGAQTVLSFAVGPEGVWAGTEQGLYHSRSFAVAAGDGPEVDGLGVRTWPSPAAGSVSVEVTTSTPGPISVEAFDVLGRRVAVLHEGAAASPLRLEVDGSVWPPGLYVVRATGGERSAHARLTIVR